MAAYSEIDRRTLIRMAAAALGCACAGVTAGCSLGVSSTPSAPQGSYREASGRLILSLASLPSLGEVGGSVKLELPRSGSDPDKIVVIRSGAEAYAAFQNRCTHMGGELELDHKNGRLVCSSLGKSKFELSGGLLEGPADSPVKAYAVTLKGDELEIALA
jgi:nitrite reductase/ring-hydroxylating ferredoxin subunit